MTLDERHIQADTREAVMPRIKPDWKEINALRNKRMRYDQGDNLFSDIYIQCRIALEGGYISKERAMMLLAYLGANSNVRSIFPNNLLYKMLENICGEEKWSSDNEGVLLDFIATFYMDYSLEDQTVAGVEISMSSDMTVKSKPLSTIDHPWAD